MKDKTKKGLIIAGLAAVCVIAVFGISRVLYKEPVQTLQSVGRTGAYDRYGRNCAGAGRDGKHREKNRFGHRSRNG